MLDDDPFDPNNWTWLNEPYEYRIYLDNRADLYTIVDEVDYWWAIRWCWNAKRDPGGAIYTRRAVSTYDDNGTRISSATLYLHVEILRRSGKRKPTPKHKWGDHKNGDTLNCKRSNLRWVTPSGNQKFRWARVRAEGSMI